jgi:hypothetical protein
MARRHVRQVPTLSAKIKTFAAYLTTSSAVARSDGGMARPSALIPIRGCKKEPQERNALEVRCLTERLGCRGMGSPLRSRALNSGAVNKTKLVLGSCHSYLGIGNRIAFVAGVEQTIFRGFVFAFLSPAKNLVGRGGCRGSPPCQIERLSVSGTVFR